MVVPANHHGRTSKRWCMTQHWSNVWDCVASNLMTSFIIKPSKVLLLPQCSSDPSTSGWNVPFRTFTRFYAGFRTYHMGCNSLWDFSCFLNLFLFSGPGGFTCYLQRFVIFRGFVAFWSLDLPFAWYLHTFLSFAFSFAWYLRHFGLWMFHVHGFRQHIRV